MEMDRNELLGAVWWVPKLSPQAYDVLAALIASSDSEGRCSNSQKQMAKFNIAEEIKAAPYWL